MAWGSPRNPHSSRFHIRLRVTAEEHLRSWPHEGSGTSLNAHAGLALGCEAAESDRIPPSREAPTAIDNQPNLIRSYACSSGYLSGYLFLGLKGCFHRSQTLQWLSPTPSKRDFRGGGHNLVDTTRLSRVRYGKMLAIANRILGRFSVQVGTIESTWSLATGILKESDEENSSGQKRAYSSCGDNAASVRTNIYGTEQRT